MYKEPDFDDQCHNILMMMMAECSKAFEQLPLIDHIEILRNILYSGVWYRYDQVRSKREEKKGEKMADPYEILGVSRDASEEEIKKHIKD